MGTDTPKPRRRACVANSCSAIAPCFLLFILLEVFERLHQRVLDLLLVVHEHHALNDGQQVAVLVR